MLTVNLVPLDRRESARIDQHPFFTSLLSISGPGGNPLIGHVNEADFATQATFLGTAARAYAALSQAAPLAFRRVAYLSKEGPSKEIAHRIYDIEMGREPLVEGSAKIPHLEQFRLMIESLLHGLCIELPEHDAFAVHKTLDLNRASLVDALASCEEIELCGRGVISAWQDLVSQWQVFQGLPSSRVARGFLDEHGLAGHMGMLEMMMEPYAELRFTPEYLRAREKFRADFAKHFDDAIGEIEARCLKKAGD